MIKLYYMNSVYCHSWSLIVGPRSRKYAYLKNW